MGNLALSQIRHSYGTRDQGTAINGVDVQVQHGRFLTLLGPSGSGKTTLLRIIGGYVRPTEGKVLLDGQDITSRSPRQRNMGMVFQDYALFPHMSVYQNVAYGLHARHIDQKEVRTRVAEMLELTRLTAFAERYPRQLSGGQQQRVAVARALVIKPAVLLMDEALGALDLKLRESMQIELKRIQQELNTTAVHVTHDQAEALTMSDQVAVMREGMVEQVASPAELYTRPINHFVATFVGQNNVLPVETGGGLAKSVAKVKGVGRLVPVGETEVAHGTPPYYVVVKPECTMLSKSESPGSLPGTVIGTKYLGAGRCVVVEADGGIELSAFESESEVTAGDRVWVSWRQEHARLIPEK